MLRINQKLGHGFISSKIYFFILILLTLSYGLFFFSSLLALKKNKPFKILGILLNNYLIRSLSDFLLIIKDSPKLFYKTFIFDKINVSLIIEKPIYFIIKILAKKNKNWIPLTFYTIPKVIAATLFLGSIFFFNDFRYFFKSIFILIIPIIFNIYCFMVENLAKTNIIFFEKHLKFEQTTENLMMVNFADKTPDFPDAINVIKEKNNKKMLQWLVYNYDIYTTIYNFIKKIENIQQKFSLYENIYVSSCYFFGWLYFWYLIIF